jgi:hypothetical protein
VERIEAIDLHEADANCGHITMVRFKGKWSVHFNFVYNRQLIREILEVVPGSVETAEFALEKSHLHPFVEIIWSAAELMAKAELYAIANQDVKGTKKHKTVKAEFNRLARASPVLQGWAKTLNRLEELRRQARYLEKTLKLTPAEARAMLEGAKEQMEFMRKRVPRSILEEAAENAIVS